VTRTSAARIAGVVLAAPLLRRFGRRLGELLALVLGITTLLFFLLQLTGDPASVMVGDAGTREQIEDLRRQYGFDRPLAEQYLRHVGRVMVGDFGRSFATNEAALSMVLARVAPTLQLAAFAIAANLLLAVPIGAWLGARPDAPGRRAGSALVFIAQGMPGFIIGLLLIQLFAVRLRWLPSIGHQDPEAWILPTLTLASFLAPNLIRVIAANVGEAMREDYICTARAQGASPGELLWRHALPNALLGATALVGAQFAFLMSGALITEVIFAWPGLGWLLIKSTETLDFPVVQASVFVVAILVFAVNTATDLALQVIDPRLRRKRA
jgi:peptide/nickel transport system permease protein